MNQSEPPGSWAVNRGEDQKLSNSREYDNQIVFFWKDDLFLDFLNFGLLILKARARAWTARRAVLAF